MAGLSQNGLTPVVALTPLEVAVSQPLGLERDAKPLSVSRSTLRDPVKAIQDVLVEALSRPPCLLSFSGGRDSSGLLALATKVSREQGLELPVPATMLFPGDEAANEDAWQALVLKELGLPDWVRINVTPGELDLVGPVAATALKRHGLLWPFNAHFHVPIIERAAGGSLVTGFGGDEIALASRSARAERLLARQERTRRPCPCSNRASISQLSPSSLATSRSRLLRAYTSTLTCAKKNVPLPPSVRPAPSRGATDPLTACWPSWRASDYADNFTPSTPAEQGSPEDVGITKVSVLST